MIRVYSSPAVSTIFSTPCCACSTTVAATRFTRATGDCLRARFFPRAAPRLDVLFRRAALFRPADFRPADFRPDAALPRRERPDAPPRFRAPDDRDLREPPRDDFFLDAMDPLLMRGMLACRVARFARSPRVKKTRDVNRNHDAWKRSPSSVGVRSILRPACDGNVLSHGPGPPREASVMFRTLRYSGHSARPSGVPGGRQLKAE